MIKLWRWVELAGTLSAMLENFPLAPLPQSVITAAAAVGSWSWSRSWSWSWRSSGPGLGSVLNNKFEFEIKFEFEFWRQIWFGVGFWVRNKPSAGLSLSLCKILIDCERMGWGPNLPCLCAWSCPYHGPCPCPGSPCRSRRSGAWLLPWWRILRHRERWAIGDQNLWCPCTEFLCCALSIAPWLCRYRSPSGVFRTSSSGTCPFWPSTASSKLIHLKFQDIACGLRYSMPLSLSPVVSLLLKHCLEGRRTVTWTCIWVFQSIVPLLR